MKNSTALYSLSLTASVDETAASGDDFMVDGFVRIILYVCQRQATYIAGGGPGRCLSIIRESDVPAWWLSDVGRKLV